EQVQSRQDQLVSPSALNFDLNNWGPYNVLPNPSSNPYGGNWSLTPTPKIDDALILKFSTSRNTVIPVPAQQDNDCTDEDNDCAKNSGLPHGKTGSHLRGFRKPFMGLSIEVPIQ